MYSYQYNDRSGIAGLLDLVERGSARLMKSGGGALTRERTPSTWKPVTPEMKAQAFAMARAGNVTCSQVAKAVGMNASTLNKMLIKEGISVSKAQGRKVVAV